jgi:hypothetical protein
MRTCSCGAILTDEEVRYYADRCEVCEKEWHERIERWRMGGDDEELDTLYDGPKETRQ